MRYLVTLVCLWLSACSTGISTRKVEEINRECEKKKMSALLDQYLDTRDQLLDEYDVRVQNARRNRSGVELFQEINAARGELQRGLNAIDSDLQWRRDKIQIDCRRRLKAGD